MKITDTGAVHCRLCRKSPHYMLVSLICLTWIWATCLVAGAATYYVDATNGNDNNPGTYTSPWKTAAKVSNSSFSPGDQILFKRGETWHEGLWLKWSGTADNPITIGAYGDTNAPAPVFDGTYPLTVTWTNVSGNVFRTTSPSWNNYPGLLIYDNIPMPSIYTIECASSVDIIKPGAVLIQTEGYYGNFWVTAVNSQENKLYGITFFTAPDKYWIANSTVQVRQLDDVTGEEVNAYVTISENGGLRTEPQSLSAPGQWYWDSDTGSIYLYADSLEAAESSAVGFTNWGFVANTQEYINIEDITFRGFKDVGIYLASCNNFTVRNVKIFGTGASGHMTGILLNETNNSLVENSSIDYSLRTGISIYLWNSELSASFNTISNNEIRYSGSAGISINTDTASRQTCVHHNTISGNLIEGSNRLSYDAAGIYLLNIGDGNRIINNTIRDGGSVQLRSAGIMVDSDVLPVTIDGNIIENNSLGGITATGSSHHITNNTIRYNGVQSWPSAQVLFFTVKENASNCTVTDNTMDAGDNQSLFMVLNGHPTDGDLPHTIDYNTYTSTNPTPFCWVNKYECSEPIDFDTWKCASGTHIEDHSYYNGTPPPPEPPTCEIIIEPPTDTKTYYVSYSTGNDNNNGTSPEQPWKNIYKISRSPAGTFGPGDSILFKRGDVWHQEGVTLKDSGIEGYPITIGAYGDPADPPPLFDATYPDFPFAIQWEEVDTNIYRTINWSWEPGVVFYNGTPMAPIATLQFSSDVSQVRPGAVLLQTDGYYCNMWVTSVDVASKQVSGITFFNDPTLHWLSTYNVEVRQLNDSGTEEKFFLTLSPPGGLIVAVSSLTQPGQWYWDDQEKSLYINSELNPSDENIELSQYRMGFNLSRLDYITIKDINLRGYKECGVYLYECNHINLQNLNITGIGSDGHRSGVLFHNTSYSSVINSTVTDSLVTGISIYSMSPGPAYGIYSWNNTISGNTVLRSGSAGISVSADFPGQAQNIINTTISNNLVEEANTLSYDSAGIYLLNISTGTRVTGNTVRNGGSRELRSAGIMLDANVTAVHIDNNIVENNSLSGLAITGKDNIITGNTVQYNSSPGSEGAQVVFFTAFTNASGCTFENNTVRSEEGQPLFKILDGKPTTGDLPHMIDNNTYEINALTVIDETYPAFCKNTNYSCDGLIDFNLWKVTECGGLSAPCRDAHSTLTILGSSPADYDQDGDVDGLDLAALATGLNPTVSVDEFAAAFGM